MPVSIRVAFQAAKEITSDFDDDDVGDDADDIRAG